MKKLSFLSIFSVGYLEISFSYRPRIDPVSIPYRSRIILLSFSYRSRFRKRKQYGNNTKPIYFGREDDMRMRLSGYLEVGLLRSKTRCGGVRRMPFEGFSNNTTGIPPHLKSLTNILRQETICVPLQRFYFLI